MKLLSLMVRVLHYAPASIPQHTYPSACFNYPSVSLHHLNVLRWWRNINRLYIIYGFRPRLSPDLPWADEPSPGNLWFSTGKFLTCLSLLMPAFSLVYSPPLLSVRLLPVYIAHLPIYYVYPRTSVSSFSPVNLRRTTTRPVSYYALF